MNTQSAQTPQNGFAMTAPAQMSKRRDDVQRLEVGPNVGILYSMIDLGTHYNEHFKKTTHLLRLSFEFPLKMQLFNVDDTEPRPTVVSMEPTFQMAEKSTLKKIADGILGRTLQPHEYLKGFDIGQFLGKVVMVNIVDQVSKKDPTKIYNKITTVQGLTEHVKQMYAIDWSLIKRHNDLVGFLIDPQGNCFQSETFSKLPDFIRDKIMESNEAKEYASRGGKFAPKAEWDGTTTPSAPQIPKSAPQPAQRMPQAPSVPQAVPQAGPKLVWLSNEYTQEQLANSNWTVQQMVDNGYARFEAPVVPAPVPPVPPAPQAVPPAPQSVPQPQAVPQPQFAPPTPLVPQPPVSQGEDLDEVEF